MKCDGCKHFVNGDCDAISTTLEGDCLLRHILWQLDMMTGILESQADEGDDDADFWKRSNGGDLG